MSTVERGKTYGLVCSLRGSTGSIERGLEGEQRRLTGVCPKLSSKSFVPISEVRMGTTWKVKDNVGSSPCMRARMSECFSDVFMTMTSFTDVSSFYRTSIG